MPSSAATAVTGLLLLTAGLIVELPSCGASVVQKGKVSLLCHRTANADLPENTLESLEYAARMGCDVVEIDLTRTLDGKIVLHHDGMLERLSDGMGLVEQTYSEELALADAGSWMGSRFGVMRIPTFDDALRVAKKLGLALYLDLKSKGIEAQVYDEVQHEGMLDAVRFGGEWNDERYRSKTNLQNIASANPGVKKEDVERKHRLGKLVIAQFFANGHEMDLVGMHKAVDAGVDGLFVDYPRLGADAVGRPAEAKFMALLEQAQGGTHRKAGRSDLRYWQI